MPYVELYNETVTLDANFTVNLKDLPSGYLIDQIKMYVTETFTRSTGVAHKPEVLAESVAHARIQGAGIDVDLTGWEWWVRHFLMTGDKPGRGIDTDDESGVAIVPMDLRRFVPGYAPHLYTTDQLRKRNLVSQVQTATFSTETTLTAATVRVVARVFPIPPGFMDSRQPGKLVCRNEADIPKQAYLFGGSLDPSEGTGSERVDIVVVKGRSTEASQPFTGIQRAALGEPSAHLEYVLESAFLDSGILPKRDINFLYADEYSGIPELSGEIVVASPSDTDAAQKMAIVYDRRFEPMPQDGIVVNFEGRDTSVTLPYFMDAFVAGG